jgi:hypothetical protein
MAEEKQELCKCSRCHSTKLLETYFSRNVKGQYKKTCDSCLIRNTQRSRLYHANNKDKVALKKKEYYDKNTESIAQYRSNHYRENIDRITEYHKNFSIQNKERKKEYRGQRKEITKAVRSKYQSEKRHNCEHKTKKTTCKICCPNGYLKSRVSGRIRDALKANKSKQSLEYLGCDIQTFREHLEKSFKEGMSWENQGKDGWDIDHIIPVLYKQDGIAPSLEEVGKRLHYTNCQAMWHTENVKKGNRYCGDYQSSDSDSESSSS